MHRQIDDGSAPLDTDELRRMVMLAYSCDPDQSMEDRNGWMRAIQAARDFDVTVLTAPHVDVDYLASKVPTKLKGRIWFHAVEVSAYGCRCLERERWFYRGYREWLRCAKEVADQMHRQEPFALAHFVSLCSFREPGNLAELECPLVWGPLGGTSGYPWRYLRFADLQGGMLEVVRNILNWYHVRYSFHIRRSMIQTNSVLAANQSTMRAIERLAGRSLPVELETGIDHPIGPPRTHKRIGEPLHILWVGRLRTWKGLPLLLHALAGIPPDVPYRLRVVGEGNRLLPWQKLAKRLQIDPHVEWIPRPPYRESMEYYRWADVFAFTSMRDTSGTGLLESLAAGVPIIGIDHQGAADIMTDQCAIPISIQNPTQTIADFAAAIVRLARSPDELLRLSHGARLRAEHYLWENKYPRMRAIYRQVLCAKMELQPQNDGNGRSTASLQSSCDLTTS